MNRPTAVSVFGILNIVFGALGICSAPFTVFGILAVTQPERFGLFPQGMPAMPISISGPMLPFLVISVILGFLFSIVLVVSGIGLLRMKAWARTASVVYGVYAIVAGILGILVNIYWAGNLIPQISETGTQAPIEGSARMGMAGGMVGGILGGCLGLVYPILLLVFMTRPNIKAAFAGPPVGYTGLEQPPTL